jgi:hypothetical protein
MWYTERCAVTDAPLHQQQKRQHRKKAPIMKSLLILVAILTGLLLVACRATPAAQPEATAEPEITAEQPTQTPTTPPMPPTEAPLPEVTDTDTPSPTDTPVPADTPVPTVPPEPTAIEAPEPSPTPEPAPTSPPETLAAPILLAPADGETFASVDSDVVFLWSEATRPLAEDEYYVLVITHLEGNDYTWTKETSFSLADGKQWLIDLGPELMWQVVIARQRTGEVNENPVGAEVSAYSLTGVSYWHK